MYDILAYLFENCQQAEIADDRERVARKLSAAGFDDSDISEALHWLAGVLRAPQAGSRALPDRRTSFRAFAPRELVLERSLAASGHTLSLEQLKLIVLMVLWNQNTPTSQLLAEDLFSTPQGRLPN